MLLDLVSFLKREINKDYILMIVFLTMCCLYQYSVFDNIEITEFHRIQGMATAMNVDISKLITRFNIWFIFFALLFMMGLGIFACFSFRTKEQKDVSKVIKGLNKLAIISSMSLFLNFCTKYNNPSTTLNAFTIISFWSILFIIIYYIIVGNSENALKWNDLKWIILTSIMVDITVNVLILHYMTIMYPFIFSLLLIASEQANKRNVLAHIKYSTIPIHFVLFLNCLYSELCVILNQNYIFLIDARIVYFIIDLFIVLLCIYRFYKLDNIEKKDDWETYSYIGIILSFAFLIGQPKITMDINTDLFEQANTALPISQFFSFGKIPILETHSAHMLSDYMFGIIYKVLNRDFLGSFFGLYNGFENTIALIIFYYMMKVFFHKDFVIFFTLFFPYYFGTRILWGSICYASILALLYLMKRNTTISYYIYWLTLAFSVLYKGDIGLAIGLGSILTLIVVTVFWKKTINFKKTCITFVQVTFFLPSIYLIVCIIRGVNPINRALEFLTIMMKSNQNWAYGDIGDSSVFAYTLTYVIVPMITLLILLHLLWLCYTNVKGEKSDKLMLCVLMTMAFAYFINFSRTLVRHSLIERPIINLVFTAAFLIPLYLYFIKEKQNNYFLVSLFILIIFCESITSLTYPTLFSPFDIATEKIADSNTFVQSLGNERIIRAKISEKFRNSYASVVDEINSLLKENETFLDFSNQTMLYALANRESPVYVSQSPGLLIDDFTQEQFIKEIDQSDKDVPLVIMANNDIKFGMQVDGILNTYRYYKIAEYIYQKYEPIELVGDYVVWCKRNREDIKNKIKNKNKTINLQHMGFEKLSYANTKIEKVDGFMTFYSNDDPYITGVEKLVSDSYSNRVDITLTYISNVNGKVQFYYTTRENNDYSEENSISVDVTKGNGIIKLNLPYWEGVQYRLDLPDKSIFTINSMHFGNTNIDDSYYNELAHNYQLENIPYLWANHDTKNAVQNDVLLEFELENDNTFYIDTAVLHKVKGNYLLVTLDTSQDEDINVELGKKENGYYVKLTNYGFKIKAGLHSYLLRVSSDYYWITNQYDYIRLYVDGSNIKEIKILEGD